MDDARPVRVYKIELMFIDFDDLGEEGTRDLIEHTRYPNHVIAPTVKAIEAREVQWTDEHPLNNSKTSDAAYRELFDQVPAVSVITEEVEKPIMLTCRRVVQLEPVPERAKRLGRSQLLEYGRSDFPKERKKLTDLIRERGFEPMTWLEMNAVQRVEAVLNEKLTEYTAFREFPMSGGVPEGWEQLDR